MGEGEPSSTASAVFRIGRDSHGNWVVQDPSGLRGGLFVNQVQALKYAMSQTGNRAQAVVMVAEVLELDGVGARPAQPRPA